MAKGRIDLQDTWLPDMSRSRLRLGAFFNTFAIEATRFFENDHAHRAVSRKAQQFRPNIEHHLERDRKLRMAAAISSQWVSSAK
jgi:hypothetical protein